MRRGLQFLFLLLVTGALAKVPEQKRFSLHVSATHPSGQFTTNRQSTFIVTNTAFDNEFSTYDGAGNVTNRVWKNAAGQVVKTQTLFWDAFGHLAQLRERDTNNNGFNFANVCDALGRPLFTVETWVLNGAVQSSPAPVLTRFTYDPEAPFLIQEIRVSQGDVSRTDTLSYGPDLSGEYGGMEGIGGLETLTTSPFNQTAVAINDGFGNVIGVVTNGSVVWNSARVNLYAPQEGFAPPRLSLDKPAYASLAWRTRPVTAAGFVQLGVRPYDPTRRAFLAADPLGHDADMALNTAFNGNPAVYFDPTGFYSGPSQFYADDILTTFNGTHHGQSIVSVWMNGPGGLEVYHVPVGDYSVFNRGSTFSTGSFAADTFLNQSARDYAAAEWRNADWRSPWGIAVGVTAGVSYTANTADAVANMIPVVGTVKNLAETGVKGGIKAVAGVFVKNVSEDIGRVEAKKIETAIAGNVGKASKDYRATFFAANPELEGQVVVHHAVEQQVLKEFPGVMTEAEIHSLENLRGIPKTINSDIHLSQIRVEWNRFYEPFRTSGTAPTKAQLMKKAAEIDAKYGGTFTPKAGSR